MSTTHGGEGSSTEPQATGLKELDWLLIVINLALLLVFVGSSSSATVPPEMVRVLGGVYVSGLAPGTVSLADFYIDAHEVTNKAYAEFVRRSGYVSKGNWEAYAHIHGDNAPVVGVTLADADAYARCYKKRLPTAFEWERACSGLEGYAYPWGDAKPDETSDQDEDRPNLNTKSVRDVGSSASDVTPSGIFDLAGNVSEWTISPLEHDSAHRAVMGSNYLFWERKAYQGIGVRPDTSSQLIGFRCVWRPK